MGCGASAQTAIKDTAAAAYDAANTAVSQGKYYAVGCKFDPDATGLQKSLLALEKGVKAASTVYENWAKSFKPLSGALINHWADTTEMPQASKDELKAAAAAISGVARAHKLYADAVVDELCVKAAAAMVKPAFDAYHAYEEAEYTLVYERKMNGKKLAETEGREAELQKASDDALAAAKKALEETLATVENDVLVPALAKPAQLAAQLCESVAEGNYPPEPAAAPAAPAVKDEGAEGTEGTEGEEGGDEVEDSIAATLKHADSDEFQANRFTGLKGKDAMEMARKKYAELRVKYKGVALPPEFKASEDMLAAHKTHLYAVSYKANTYCKKSIPKVFGPEKVPLKEMLAKQMGLANLKQAVNDLAGKVAAAHETNEATFSAAVEAAGNELSGVADDDAGSIKEAKDVALQYQGAVYKWKVVKDRIEALEAEEKKAEELKKPWDDKKFGEMTRLKGEFPKLEGASTELSSKFYTLAQAIYEEEGTCAVSARALPAVKAMNDAHVAFFASCKECFASN